MRIKGEKAGTHPGRVATPTGGVLRQLVRRSFERNAGLQRPDRDGDECARDLARKAAQVVKTTKAYVRDLGDEYPQEL